MKIRKHERVLQMRKLAHFGIPVKEKPANATYLSDSKLWIGDPSKTKNNIEHLFFEEGSPMPQLLKDCAHISYLVDDMEEELKGAEILIPPFKPFPNLTAAFIVEDGIPIELMHQA